MYKGIADIAGIARNRRHRKGSLMAEARIEKVTG
jgi:hypothetical protein